MKRWQAPTRSFYKTDEDLLIFNRHSEGKGICLGALIMASSIINIAIVALTINYAVVAVDSLATRVNFVNIIQVDARNLAMIITLMVLNKIKGIYLTQHVNAKSIKQSLDEFRLLITNRNIDILRISET